MTELHEMTDAERLDITESWIGAEVRRCRRKLGISNTDLIRAMIRVISDLVNDEVQSES